MERILITARLLRRLELRTESLVHEFLASEQLGQQGVVAHAYEAVLSKHAHELGANELRVLKAVLLLAKLGARNESKEEVLTLIAALSG